MNRVAAPLVFGLLLILTITGCVSTLGCSSRNDPAPIVVDRPSAIRISTPTSICSGTKLGPRTIITAAHCFSGDNKVIEIDGVEASIDQIITDSNDHALVTLNDIILTGFATVGPMPVEGDIIHFWGNPAGLHMLLRRGYVSGFDAANILYDANGFQGDSGAGVFDVQKRLIGIISYVKFLGPFAVMGSFPLNFTMQEMASAGIMPVPYMMTGSKATVNMH